jgi:hypothetical protein
VVSIDLETRGVDPNAPESEIVGVGVAWRIDDSVQARYFAYQNMDTRARCILWSQIGRATGAVIAYNLLFDGAWIAKECEKLQIRVPRWTHCGYALQRQLATEGFPGQSWSLKSAQVDLLGWEETNESGIETWLLSHGLHKQGPRLIDGESPEDHLRRIDEWVAENPTKRKVRPDKSQMWRVPAAILGEYCILDCLSTLQLFDEVQWPALERFPELEAWHRDYFVPVDKLLWEQQAFGIRLDRSRFEAHGEFLRGVMRQAEADIRKSSIGPRIVIWEEARRTAAVKEHEAKEPEKFLKRKPLGEEPAQLTKSGKPNKNHAKWVAKRDAPDVLSKNWEKWRDRLDALRASDEFRMNIGSDAQRRWLLYGETASPGPVKWRPTGKTRKKKKPHGDIEVPVFEIDGVNGWVELEGTDSGELPTNGDLLTQLPPDFGRPLQMYAGAEQELGYVEAYLAAARLAPSGEWRIHPGWVSPGTKTGRLAGREPNLQQVPKTIEFLECFVADPGHVWVEMDWSSLEPHVLAELSRDPALLKLYGPGAKKHDVYLYSGAHYAVLGDEIRPHYDTENPDVPAAKKACKGVREACKVVFLAKGYGAGAQKIHMGLRLAGFKLTPEQAKQISDSHDTMYAASGKQFHAVLEQEWEQRGGWVLSGLGHPIGVFEGKKKDLINRVIQKTGHDIHTMFVVRVARRLEQEGIPAKGIVWDFHDQCIYQVPEAHGPRCLEIMREEVAAMNEILGAHVTLKGEPKLSTNMAHAKEAEFTWKPKAS